MNNFEKFNNKQLSAAEASSVVGGVDYTYCLTQSGPDGFCISHFFNLHASALGNNCYAIVNLEARAVCLNAACDAAILECTIQ